jgi:hypothetical protein
MLRFDFLYLGRKNASFLVDCKSGYELAVHGLITGKDKIFFSSQKL